VFRSLADTLRGVAQNWRCTSASSTNCHKAMSRHFEKQIKLADFFCSRLNNIWDRAENELLSMEEVHAQTKEWIYDHKDYKALTSFSRERIHGWNACKRQEMFNSQLWGRWYEGKFYGCYTELPEEAQELCNKNLLPSAQWWLKKTFINKGNGKMCIELEPTGKTYYLSKEYKKPEILKHLPA
jgi:hypothetical protein